MKKPLFPAFLREVLPAFFLLTLSPCASLVAKDETVKDTLVRKPNIVFILADDLGYSDMSWQGSPIQTPNLDKLRAGGMFLDRCYAQPQCSPSRAAFLSGRYPYRYGLHEHIVVPQSLNGLPGQVSMISAQKPQAAKGDDGPVLITPDGRETIAQKLKEGGYETAMIGKWHVGCHLQSYLPHNQGFDYSFSAIDGEINYWNYTHYGKSDIISNGQKFYAKSPLDSEASGNTYATDLWAQKAIEVIHRHDTNRPLFMYLAFNAPHWPLQAPQKILDKYPLESIPPYWAGPHTEHNRTAANRRTYMAMVDVLDSAIGKVLESLREKNMLENTLIVFSSDNGGIPDADNRPLRSVKGDSFEGGVRVPAIASWPGVIKPGSTNNQLVYIADWYPTFAELAGLSVEGEALDGFSALKVLHGGASQRKAVPIISEGRHAMITPQYSLVGGGADYQKLISQSLSNFQLFDLDVDVSQRKSTDLYQQTAQEMRQALALHLQNVNRGYFDWDNKYNKDRRDQSKSDHSHDDVVNDLPKLTLASTNGQAAVTISPASKELTYRLQRSSDGKTWKDVADYVSKTDAPHYTFPSFPAAPEDTHYRVQTELHLGLPARDVFSLDGKYKIGALTSGSVPLMEGFLPRCDVTGRVEIVDQSLVCQGWPSEGGALQLASDNANPESMLTRYFIEPRSRGKLYASMLVQFQAPEAECEGRINWLRQEGWNGPAVTSASLSFQSDGIFLTHSDLLAADSTKRLASYDGRVVSVVFEFDLGTTGKDTLKVYLNPDLSAKSPEPVASYVGEFTVDRLAFEVTGRPGSRLTIDDLRLGTTMADVLPSNESKVAKSGWNPPFDGKR
jgi:arylsulfatase A-like enzyme